MPRAFSFAKELTHTRKGFVPTASKLWIQMTIEFVLVKFATLLLLLVLVESATTIRIATSNFGAPTTSTHHPSFISHFNNDLIFTSSQPVSISMASHYYFHSQSNCLYSPQYLPPTACLSSFPLPPTSASLLPSSFPLSQLLLPVSPCRSPALRVLVLLSVCSSCIFHMSWLFLGNRFGIRRRSLRRGS